MSVDGLADAERMAEHASADFPVLADPDAEVARRYGVFDLLGDGVAAPATLIITKDGRVVGAHVGTDIADRVPAAAIIQALADLGGQET